VGTTTHCEGKTGNHGYHTQQWFLLLKLSRAPEWLLEFGPLRYIYSINSHRYISTDEDTGTVNEELQQKYLT